MQTGREFKIFQDKNDIKWGQNWKERLDKELFNVTFLIPIVTPSYFRSNACRDEFDKFAIREKQLGKKTLILPIYYLEADELSTKAQVDDNGIAQILSERNWSDWRALRFKALQDVEVERAIEEMARTIKQSMKTLEGEIMEANSHREEARAPLQQPTTVVDLSKFSPDVPEARQILVDKRRLGASVRSTYYAYTKEFDEIVQAEALLDTASTDQKGAEFRRLLRRLKSGNEELILQSREHFQKLNAPQPLAVIFLVDNSGSLRERDRIPFVAAWLQIISDVLEQGMVPHEILGFTTISWKGGRPFQLWKTDGKPPAPGRLNELRHIVYKSFTQKNIEVLANLELMASGRLLKENIDGEALLWAYDRAKDFGAPRTIIIMISDGAPVDDATLFANEPSILEKHLIQTVYWLSQMPDISLVSLGIGHETQRYYDNAVVSKDAKSAGIDLLQALPKWLTQQP